MSEPAIAGPGAARRVEPAGEEALRAQTYGLLAALLAAPPDETTIGLLRDIDPDAGQSGDLLGASWQMLRVAAERARPADLEDEYHALFIGLGRGQLVPHGSWYLTGFLMEQPLARLRTDLRELGYERQEGVREPEDHAAALCDVMALAIGGEPPLTVAQQAEFFSRHIEPWMERFFRDMQQADSARFYRAVGQLGEQFMNVEAQAFRMLVPAAGAEAATRA